MAKAADKELANVLRENRLYLAKIIATQPTVTSDLELMPSVPWASNPKKEFVLAVSSYSDLLASLNWPFPAYLDFNHALQDFLRTRQRARLRRKRGGPWQWLENRRLEKLLASARKSDLTTGFFRTHSQEIFEFWKASPLLANKLQILKEIEQSYQLGFWAVCLPAALPLLEFLIRVYYGGDNDRDLSIGTLCSAFKSAKVSPRDLKPGYEEEGLGITGIFLCSFLEFAGIYYGPFKPKPDVPAVLNRHAILHGRTEYWNCEYTSKILTFLDLTVRLQRPLEVLIHGSKAPWLKTSGPG